MENLRKVLFDRDLKPELSVITVLAGLLSLGLTDTGAPDVTLHCHGALRDLFYG
jgi:hypothetical protein